MAADKPRPTMADYVTIALSPGLIMVMIVSLVFFLLAVLYRGEYAERLHNILFFFVFGIVLVARLSMDSAFADRAPLYGAVLALLTAAGMGKFVGSDWPINTALIALAWWLSYQLTYSCTYIDEKAENTGAGVLQGAGLDQAPVKPAPPIPAASTPPPKEGKRGREPSWWERFQQYRAERKKTQPPGVWVVYFALAALPIFGLGQALIEPGDTDRRNYTFWLMTLYLGSSLGLLVTTAFLGVRRYLRQRRLEMPKAVTTAWLFMGAVLLVALLAVGAVLPRPQAEISALSLLHLRSKDVDASKHAVTQAEPGKGDGQPAQQKQDPKGDPVKSEGDQGKDGKGQPKGSSSKTAKDSAKDAGKKSDAGGDAKGKQQGAKGDPGKKTGDNSGPPDQPQAPPDVVPWLSQASEKLKWVIFAILALVTVVFILRGGLRYLANFTEWARRLLESLRAFWQRLFGSPEREAAKSAAAKIVPPKAVPFHAFANPFANDRAETMAPADLVRYSFEALEAWAVGRNCGRGAQETPIEFTLRLADEVVSLENETKRLGILYARVLYARGALTPDWRGTLEEVWQRLDR